MKVTNEQTKLLTPPHQKLCQDDTDNGTNSEFCSLSSVKEDVLIPCYNNALTINSVVTIFQKALPNIIIYPYDNNFSDLIVSLTNSADAVALNKARQGKSIVICSIHRDLKANCYITANHSFSSPMAQECYEVTSNGGGLTK